MTQRARAWCFTLNNYGDQDERMLQELECRYIVYGRETGESGTPHLQGYVFFSERKTLSSVRRVIPGAHLSVRGGTHKQASDYCKKDGDVYERGDPPLDPEEIRKKGCEANAEKWKAIRQYAIIGDMESIGRDHPKEYIQLKPRLESLYAPRNEPLDGDLLHEWWVGPTGTGKSRLLWKLYPDHFAKSINKWWDGYRFEPVVAIEEWSPDNGVTAQALKRWADRYPFSGEIKGGVLQRLRPKKIIVLSNYTMEQCFPRHEDLAPLTRRFKVIDFPNGESHAGFRAAWFNNPPAHSLTVSDTTEDSEMFDIEDDETVLNLDFLYSQE